MITQRHFIQSLGVVGAGVLMKQVNQAFAIENDKDIWFMPDEGAPHKRTWMAFGPSRKVWGSKLLLEVQINIKNLFI